MEILVHGRNVELETEVEEESRRKVGRLERLASDIRRVEVEFSEIRNPRVADAVECEIRVRLTKNLVKAHGAAPDQRTALDRATAKAEHQLDKVHSKRVSRSKPKHGTTPPEGVTAVPAESSPDEA
ncbi:MAG: ribosome hibernation-promoting factor, HPF/YfiA family [Acidimicrobiia bacterium]